MVHIPEFALMPGRLELDTPLGALLVVVLVVLLAAGVLGEAGLLRWPLRRRRMALPLAVAGRRPLAPVDPRG